MHLPPGHNTLPADAMLGVPPRVGQPVSHSTTGLAPGEWLEWWECMGGDLGMSALGRAPFTTLQALAVALWRALPGKLEKSPSSLYVQWKENTERAPQDRHQEGGALVHISRP